MARVQEVEAAAGGDHHAAARRVPSPHALRPRRPVAGIRARAWRRRRPRRSMAVAAPTAMVIASAHERPAARAPTADAASLSPAPHTSPPSQGLAGIVSGGSEPSASTAPRAPRVTAAAAAPQLPGAAWPHARAASRAPRTCAGPRRHWGSAVARPRWAARRADADPTPAAPAASARACAQGGRRGDAAAVVRHENALRRVQRVEQRVVGSADRGGPPRRRRDGRVTCPAARMRVFVGYPAALAEVDDLRRHARRQRGVRRCVMPRPPPARTPPSRRDRLRRQQRGREARTSGTRATGSRG